MKEEDCENPMVEIPSARLQWHKPDFEIMAIAETKFGVGTGNDGSDDNNDTGS